MSERNSDKQPNCGIKLTVLKSDESGQPFEQIPTEVDAEMSVVVDAVELNCPHTLEKFESSPPQLNQQYEALTPTQHFVASFHARDDQNKSSAGNYS